MKEGYKETTIGRIPEDWEALTIDQLRNRSDRYSFTGGPFGSNLKAEHYTTDGVRVIQLQNIGEGKFLNESKIFTSEEKADELFSCNIFPDEIILAKMAPVARSCKIPDFHNRYLMCSDGIRLSVDRNKFDDEFVFQAINSEYFLRSAESKSTGTTRARIGLSELRELTIGIPKNKSEQSKIASILSTVDDKIDSINQRIEETRKLKQGLMQQLLTRGIGHSKFKDSPLGEIPESWEVAKVGSIAQTFAGGTPNRSIREYYSGIIPWIKSGEVRNRSISSSEECVTEKAIKETATKLIKPDSVLVALYGATAGNVGILKISACSNQAVLAVDSITGNVINGFIYYMLIQAAKKLINLTQGSGQPNLSKAIVDSILIPIPLVEEQIKITGILGGVDDKLDILQEKKAEYEQLKKGLMQQLLTGKIRVKLSRQL